MDGNTFHQSSEKILLGLAKKRKTGMEPPKAGERGFTIPFPQKDLDYVSLRSPPPENSLKSMPSPNHTKK